MKQITILFTLLFFASCGATTIKEVPKQTKTTFLLEPGTWKMTFDITCDEDPIDKIDIRFEVDEKQNITFINHTERIKIDDVRIMNDSITIVPQQFNSYFKGVKNSPTNFTGDWYNQFKKDYSIPFTAKKISDGYMTFQCANSIQKKYEVTFSNNTSDAYKAVGIFNTCNNNYCYGTFLTETGDYRFLEGKLIDNQLVLSCFDGSHLFTFTGETKGDSIVNGTFNSGNHWYEPWVAKLNPKASLTDPNTLTYLKEGFETIDIKVQNLNGDTIHFNKEYYQGNVNVITIMGTWCPNCLDEANYFTELFMKYNKQGFNVLPVSFEASDNFDENIHYLKRFFARHHIPFQPYYGGQIKKSTAGEKFHMLNKIMSFPTSIFIDKKGNVRKIHTGFYGPGTGEYYNKYKKETEEFVEMLLAE